MIHPKDPPRLLDPGSGADPRLRRALEAARTELPSSAQLAALSAKVAGHSLAAGAATGTGVQAKALLSKLGLGKLTVGVAVLAAAASFHALSSSPRTGAPGGHGPSQTGAHTAGAAAPPLFQTNSALTQPAAARPAEAVRHAHPAPPPPPRPSSSTDTAGPTRAGQMSGYARAQREHPVAESRTATQRTYPDARGTSRSGEGRPGLQTRAAPAEYLADTFDEPAQEEAEDIAQPSELQLLAQVQQLLVRDPEAALELTDKHALRYPRGAFVEEREALAVDALQRLGRTQAAETRARTFLRRYPASPYGQRMRQWLK